MAFRKFKKMYKRRPRATRKRVPRKLRRTVKKVISRMAEKKTQTFYTTAQVPILNVDNPSFNLTLVPVSPYTGFCEIAQGTGQGNRIGNRVELKSLRFSGTISVTPYDVTTNPNPKPVIVILWIFYDKTVPTSYPSPLTNFFQMGNSVNQMQGDLEDLYAPINKDRYRVVAKRAFKIGYASYDGTGSGGAGGPAQQSNVNNDFKMFSHFSINLTKAAAKMVKFQDNGNIPTSRSLFAMIETVRADGENMATGTETMARYQYNIDCKYTDI